MNHLFRGAGRLTLVVTESASGTVLKTACGRELLDFTSGMGVTNTGHCHPKVVEAAKRQCDALIHGQVNLGYHKPMMDLTTELMKPGVMPHSKLDKIFYSTTGSEAVENGALDQKRGRICGCCFHSVS
jgi:4-aminobutyrate aminotransferase